MSQQLDSSSPKKLSPTDASESVPRTEPVNPNQVLDIAPLRMVPGIFVPLQTVIPEPADVTRANIIGKSSNDDHVHIFDDDVHTPDGDVQVTEEEENNDDDVPKDNDNEDVSDIGNISVDAGTGTATSTGTHVVDRDDYFYNDLSKVIPKKRKARAIVDSDSDVDVDAQDIPPRKRPTTSKLATSFPEVPIDNISFHYPSRVNRWKYVHHKRLALERELAQNALENKEIMDLIHEDGLLKNVVHLPACYEMLVKEFIVNLLEDCADRKSKDFRKVYVRGKCVTFSSTVINNFLGRFDEAQPELEVTDNKICEVITAKQVKVWPLKGKLSASKLSIKYAMLYKIGAANWVPTNHKSIIATVLGKFIYAIGTKTKFDYGTYIFDQTMKHVGSYSYPNILSENDVVCKRESALSFHYKLFQGTHVPNIVTTLARTSKDSTPAGKATVIAMLRETCKELESRKLTLEKLISSLEMEEGVDFVENEAGPAEHDEEEEASQDDGTDEEDNVGSSSSESED
ncbi:uncharacterized protein LOC131661932 [Vicia villosa]|uniref:uncharacterized protein LOC131661932 n=1 Tax=Vicia villosa TaxID=3911 RepID=UPI00273C9654|nr:uncharacterized protein LOC131661932 [Vicia villosa]